MYWPQNWPTGRYYHTMNSHRREELFQKFERASELPLLVLSVLFVPILIVPFAVELDGPLMNTVDTLDWVIWAIFAQELMIRTYLSPSRIKFLRTHPFDILIVVLPLLRPLRLLRTVRALRMLRAIRLLATLGFIGNTFRRIASRKGVQLSLVFALLAFIVSAILLNEAERGNSSEIDSLGTALWWAVATITNVGAGDITPVTPFGKGIGVFLMISGVSVFTSLAGNVAAVLLEDTDETAQLRREIQELKQLIMSNQRD